MKIAVLLGGSSPERFVSISSGRGIVKALRELGHDVSVIDPAAGLNQKPEAEIFLENVGGGPPADEYMTGLSPRNYIDAIGSHLLDDIDLAFVILHGKWGEDGTVQSLLELRGIRYTGSGVMASSIAMDKAMSKKLFRHHGTPTADWYSYNKHKSKRDKIKSEIIRRIKLPFVVKPNDQGSSVAITIVTDLSTLDSSLDEAERYSDIVLIEEYIEGAELTVGILGDQPLPVIEIRPHNGFYDYKHKYTKGMTDYLVPAPVDKSFAVKLQDTALETFNALGCKSFGRVDFRVGKDGTPYCLEVNTIPGMTETSLVPKAAAAAGLSFVQVVRRIVDLSFEE
ncbi:MAG: D-alanine--D-alanine ligase [Candidatus Kryptoniota bacterium]